MKTSMTSEPRWICRAARHARALFGEAAPGAGHLERCPHCQAFFSAGDELDGRLRRDAVRDSRLVPDGLEQRLIYAVNRATRSAPPPRATTRFSLVPLAGMLAGAALLALLFFSDPPAPNHGAPTAMAPSRTVAAVDPVAENRWSALTAPAAILKTNPLQDEVDFVYSDAKSALHFLELNFLPDGAKRSE